jgi:hypothetical protein
MYTDASKYQVHALNIYSVASLSVARMIALSIKRAGTVPVFDPSYSTPAIYIFSALEINIGIMIASIPIFWPLVASLAANKILVVNEIEVRNDRRDSQNVALAEQGATEFSRIPDLDFDMDKGGRTSRMSVVVTGKETGVPGKLARSASKLTKSSSRLHKSKPSNSSSNKDIELSLSRVSQESQQNLNLSTKTSNNSLSLTSSSPPENKSSMDLRNGSVTHYQDRYVQDWVVPGFETPRGVGLGLTGTGNSTTVERAEIPFDHIRALEK